MPECGYRWSTRSAGKNGPELHEHTCRKPAGHDSLFHACVDDGGAIHVVERRYVDPTRNVA